MLVQGHSGTMRVLHTPDWQNGTALRSMGEALMDRGRCVGLHLAYGVSDDTPRALDAVRAFFGTCRHLAGLLAAVADPEEADRIAVDALSQIEGATLWLAVNGDRTAMQRTLDRMLAEADALQARHHGQAGTKARAGS